MQRIKFLTLGCKVNQYDTQLIREQCLAAGFKETNRNDLADICVVNTCTVTHNADRDSLNIIRRAKRDNPRGKVVVTGCLTELDDERITKTFSSDLVVKNKDKNKLAGILLSRFGRGKRPVSKPGFCEGISFFQGHTRAFLKVQDGCNNFCSYCKVPFVRGRSRSRDEGEIILEAGRLARNGFSEIVLTGICLGSYGKDLKDGVDLSGLIAGLEKINGISRIRLSSIEAKDVTAALIRRIAASEKVCKHLHIPLQSGDDTILGKMNRHYRAAGFLRLVKSIRQAVPEIAITTDALVGFPGESETNFLNTVKLLKKINPLKTHIFPFSPRPGTLAARFPGIIPTQDLRKRLVQMNRAAEECSDKYMRGFLGNRLPVLIEGRVASCPGHWQGYTDNYMKVQVCSKPDINKRIVTVKLAKLSGGVFKANFR